MSSKARREGWVGSMVHRVACCWEVKNTRHAKCPFHPLSPQYNHLPHLIQPSHHSPLSLICLLLLFSPENHDWCLCEHGTGRVNLLTDGIFYLQSIWTRPQDYDSKHLDFINMWSVIVYWHSPVPAPPSCREWFWELYQGFFLVPIKATKPSYHIYNFLSVPPKRKQIWVPIPSWMPNS